MLYHYLLVFVLALTTVFSSAIVQAEAMESMRFRSVEESLRSMDKDQDGMVSVQEVRAYIELVHGKSYQPGLLDEMESSALGKSCSSPFAKPMYSR